jgi:hypothetical protein
MQQELRAAGQTTGKISSESKDLTAFLVFATLEHAFKNAREGKASLSLKIDLALEPIGTSDVQTHL